MEIKKTRVIWILIILIIFILSYYFDTEKNEYYLQSDIYEFKRNYLTLIVCTFSALIILIYIILLKFKIRDKIKELLVLSFYSIFSLLFSGRSSFLHFYLLIAQELRKNLNKNTIIIRKLTCYAILKQEKDKWRK